MNVRKWPISVWRSATRPLKITAGLLADTSIGLQRSPRIETVKFAETKRSVREGSSECRKHSEGNFRLPNETFAFRRSISITPD
jgi:hypothetical protein